MERVPERHSNALPSRPSGDEEGVTSSADTLAAQLGGMPANGRPSPGHLPRLSIARLQRAAGNRAVAGLFDQGTPDGLPGARAGGNGSGAARVGGYGGSATAGPLAEVNRPLPGMPTIQLLAASADARLVIQRVCVREDAPPGAEQEQQGPSAGALMGEMANLVEGEQAAGSTPASAGPTGEGPAGEAPPPEAAAGKPMLRRGSRGPAVIELQGRLNDRAAEAALVPDGIFGPLTHRAVVEFQSANGLVPDGIVGPLTWGKLLEGQPDVPPDVDPLAGLPVQVVGHGASEPAVAAARQAAIELFGDLRDPSRAQLMTSQVALDVIPHDKQLTDLPEYAHLRGTQTFDGRLWDTVRGIRTTINGVIRFAVAEEDLVSVPGKPAGYGPGFLAAHEGGHALEASSLTPAQAQTLTSLYQARLAASGPLTPTTPPGPATQMWLSPAWYSAANQAEYFGNSVAAYLGHPYTTSDEDQAMYSRAWLQANDAGMYALLQSVFAH